MWQSFGSATFVVLGQASSAVLVSDVLVALRWLAFMSVQGPVRSGPRPWLVGVAWSPGFSARLPPLNLLGLEVWIFDGVWFRGGLVQADGALEPTVTELALKRWSLEHISIDLASVEGASVEGASVDLASVEGVAHAFGFWP